MHGTTITSAALLGLSAIAAARPAASGPPKYTGSSSSGSNGQEAFEFPLSNGFPNVSVDALKQIELQAHGELPNGPSPPSIQPDSIVSLAFIAFNELFEVAFFTELIYNITNNVPAYDDIPNRDAILTIHQADEELHELNANGAFNHFTNATILPCEYIFPVNNFNDAIALASQFTDVVLSTLPDIRTIFGTDGNVGLIRGVGAVIGQEREQNGFYRELLGKPPARLPFLTQGARDFAFSAIVQNFVVEGSCSQLGLFENPPAGQGLKIFDILNVLTSPDDFSIEHDIQAQFSAVITQSSNQHSNEPQSFAQQSLYMTYLNRANVPVSVPLEDIKLGKEGELTFTASFPGQSESLGGLTIAAVTNTNHFTSPDDVANATIFGPGLIEVD